MTVPTVTVAMSVYNGGAKLRLAVQSVLNQTFQDWELYIVDDGSTDGAVAELSNLDEPRIRILCDGQNLGLATRLNQVIGLARAPLIARMDHDDIAHPDRFFRQVEFLKMRTDVDLLATRCLSMSESEELIGELPFAEKHKEICRRPWLGFHLAHPSWMGRTDWFRRHLYAVPAPYCCEDQELLLRAFKSSVYHALPEPLLAYRVRSKVEFQKLFRTRTALVGMQAFHFLNAGLFSYAVLAMLAFATRVAADSLRPLLPGLRSDLRRPQLPENRSWIDAMSRIKNEAVVR